MAQQGPQGEHVGRTRLEAHLLEALFRASVGIGVDPVEAQPLAAEELLGSRVHHLDVRNAHPCEVAGRDVRQHGVALESHHAAEAAAQVEGVDPQAAGEVQHRVAFDALVCGARLARGLFEGSGREDAFRRRIGGELLLGAREVLDLRGDQPGVRHAAVHRHGERIASPGAVNGLPDFGKAQQFVFFGGDHVGKGTLFFASRLHAARVASR